MIRDYFRIALRNLTRRKLRSWLTLIGIIIGITSVIALIGLGQGLEAAITGIFGTLGTDVLTVTAEGGFGPPGFGVQEPLTTDNLEEISKTNGVNLAAGRLISTGKLEYNKKVLFGMAASIPEGDGRKLFLEKLGLETEQGRMLKEGERDRILVGYGLNDEGLGNYLGRRIEPGSRLLIEGRQFEVIGVLEKQGSFLFDNIIIMNEDDLRDIFDYEDDVLDIIALQVDDTDEIPRISGSIEKYLRKERDVKEGEEDFSISTPEGNLEDISSVLSGVQIFVYVIASISILVGGFGIMNTMLTSVLERTRDIGIMKSIGARNSNIFMLFFIESGLIGMVGGIIGVLMGAGLATALAALGKSTLGSDIIQTDISMTLVFGALLGSFGLGSLFGIMPAIKAAHLHPVDALRHKK